MSDWSDDEGTSSAPPAPIKSGGGDRKPRDDDDSGEKKEDTGCRKCKKEGHMARDCDLPDVCHKCKEEGHMARDCEKPDVCRRCGEEGHMVRECSQEEATRQITDEDGTVREIYVPKQKGDEELFGNEISTGINFDKYFDKEIPVECKGDNIPKPVASFAEAGLRPLVLNNIKASKYTVPTPVQRHAIPIIMGKRDLISCAQTGSGKTAAFLLPIIHNLLEEGADSNAGSQCQKPQAVIITPTRELAIQIHEQSRKFAYGSSLKCVIAYGGTSVGTQLRNLERGCNILACTPGRLGDFLEKGRISFEDLQYFILDEADRMLDMGFGGDIEKFMNNPTMPDKDKRNTLMFSATFASDVQAKARDYLRKDKVFLTIGLVGGACTDVKQEFFEVGKRQKKQKLLEIVADPLRDPAERMLIFVNTKKNADFLATHLCGEDKPATSIHGDRLQREREEVLHDFKTGKRPLLVATAVAARGLDIPKVATVVNFDMPTEVDEYVHRIGRTGRVGNVGKAISFYDPDFDSGIMGPLCTMLEKCGVELPSFMGGGGDGGEAAGGGDDDDGW